MCKDSRRSKRFQIIFHALTQHSRTHKDRETLRDPQPPYKHSDSFPRRRDLDIQSRQFVHFLAKCIAQWMDGQVNALEHPGPGPIAALLIGLRRRWGHRGLRRQWPKKAADPINQDDLNRAYVCVCVCEFVYVFAISHGNCRDNFAWFTCVASPRENYDCAGKGCK